MNNEELQRALNTIKMAGVLSDILPQLMSHIEVLVGIAGNENDEFYSSLQVRAVRACGALAATLAYTVNQVYQDSEENSELESAAYDLLTVIEDANSGFSPEEFFVNNK